VSERRSILLLCDESRSHAANVLQHIDALATLSAHDVYRFNPVDRPDACRVLDPEEFDVVAIHYSIAVWSARYVPPELVAKLARFRGLTVQFIQDEYRSVDAVTGTMRELGVDVLFTCVPEPEASEIYDSRLPGVTRLTTLPGYVPDELVGRPAAALDERPLDVGYRARDLPFWLGRLGREKVEIAEGFTARAAEHGVRCDISSREEDRIYGEAWNRFLGSCRATLGTESGSSIVDFDGTVEARGKDYVARRPEATSEEVQRDLLSPYEGNVVIATASPRLFEAAALRTAMVLFRGRYSGVVEPGTHYLPLEKDFSNMAEVARQLRDTALLEELVGRAYDDLIASGRYSLRTMIAQFDEAVAEHAPAAAQRSKHRYRRARLRRRIPSWRQPSKFRVRVGNVLKPAAGLMLIACDGRLRSLAAAGLRTPEARSAGLGRDLWRLTALRYGTRRGSFHVVPELGEDQVLFLSSRAGPGPTGAVAGAVARRAAQAMAVGGFQELVWNHSRVDVSVGLAGGVLLALPIGRHGVEGAHGFRALAAVSRRRPGLLLAALEPLLLEPLPEPAETVGVEA
jgi:hypothetical protein